MKAGLCRSVKSALPTSFATPAKDCGREELRNYVAEARDVTNETANWPAAKEESGGACQRKPWQGGRRVSKNKNE